MEIINSAKRISLKWQIQKGIGKESENFEGSQVYLFIKSDSNKWLLPCTADKNGLVAASIPEDMPLQTYGFELVWIKNENNIGRSRCVCRTEKKQVYTLSSSENAETGSVTLHLRTIASLYGYDGFSAYEIAVFKGYTTLSEDEWTKSQSNIINDYEFDTPLLDVTKEYTPTHEGRRAYICTNEAGETNGNSVSMHSSIGRIVRPTQIALGKTIGCHLGDMLIVCNVGNSYVGKLITNEEAGEYNEKVVTLGLLGSTNKLYTYKGTKASLDALKAEVTSGEPGYVYNVEDTGMNYAIVSIDEDKKIASFTLAGGEKVELAEGDKISLTITSYDEDGNGTSVERVCRCFFMPVEPNSEDKVGVLYYTDEKSADHLVQISGEGYDEITLGDYISTYSIDQLEQEGIISGDYIESDSITTKNVITWDALGALTDISGKIDKPEKTVESGKVLMTTGDGETEWATPQMGMTDEEKADLERLMEKQFPMSASVSLSPSVIEKGVSTPVKLTWGNALIDGTVVESTATVNGEAATSPFADTVEGVNKTYTLVISQVGGTRTIKYTPMVTAVYPTWYGFAVADSAITKDNIESLVSALASSKSLMTSASFNAVSKNDSATKRFCIVMPYTASKIVSNNFNILSDFTLYSVAYKDTTYRCYIGKDLILPGTFTYSIS